MLRVAYIAYKYRTKNVVDNQGLTSNESSEREAVRRYYQRMRPRRAAPTNEQTSVRSIAIEWEAIRRVLLANEASFGHSYERIDFNSFDIDRIRPCSCSFVFVRSRSHDMVKRVSHGKTRMTRYNTRWRGWRVRTRITQ